MFNLIKRFYKDESGATMVEYAIMVALIAVAVAAIVVLVGLEMESIFQDVVNCLQSPTSVNCQITGTD